MPPVSRPTVPLPPGTPNVPASVPSARSAVSTRLPAEGSGAAIGAGTAERGAALPSRKPQDPQKRLAVVFWWPHCGHITALLAGAAAGGGGATTGGGGATTGAGIEAAATGAAATGAIGPRDTM